MITISYSAKLNKKKGKTHIFANYLNSCENNENIYIN